MNKTSNAQSNRVFLSFTTSGDYNLSWPFETVVDKHNEQYKQELDNGSLIHLFAIQIVKGYVI